MVTPEEFVKIWQSSQTAKEIAEKTGSTPGNVCARAYHYRKKGVKLKMLNSGPQPMDCVALNKIAVQYAPKVKS